MELPKHAINNTFLRELEASLYGSNNYGYINTFVRAFLTLVLRAGMLMIQIQCIPTDNVHKIIIHNVMDIAICTTMYALIGFTFLSGHGPVIGYSEVLTSKKVNIDIAIEGWCVIMMTTAFVTVVVAGRMKGVAITLFYAFMSGFILPVIFHVTLSDYGGAAAANIVGGSFSFVVMAILGRRVIRLTDIDSKSMTTDAAILATVGYFMVIIGFFGMSLPTYSFERRRMPENYIGQTVMCYIISMASGMVTLTFLHTVFRGKLFTYWTTLSCVQGGLTGIISICAGTDIYSPLSTLGIASLGSSMCFFVQSAIYKTDLEDYTNAISIHLITGIYSALVPPIFASYGYSLGISQTGLLTFVHLLWQFISILVIILFSGTLTALLIYLLDKFRLLRNATEVINHQRAKDIQEQLPQNHSSFFKRLFSLTDDSIWLEPVTKDLSEMKPATNNKASGEAFTGDYNPNKMKSAKDNVIEMIHSARTISSNTTSDEDLTAIVNNKSRQQSGDEFEIVTRKIKRTRHIYTLPDSVILHKIPDDKEILQMEGITNSFEKALTNLHFSDEKSNSMPKYLSQKHILDRQGTISEPNIRNSIRKTDIKPIIRNSIRRSDVKPIYLRKLTIGAKNSLHDISNSIKINTTPINKYGSPSLKYTRYVKPSFKKEKDSVRRRNICKRISVLDRPIYIQPTGVFV